MLNKRLYREHPQDDSNNNIYNTVKVVDHIIEEVG